MATILMWFRQDLRLDDNPALQAAMSNGNVLPVYILDEKAPGQWAPGGAGRWWLHHSLDRLSAGLGRHNSRLILRKGDAYSVIQSLVKESNVSAVYWNRCYEPYAIQRDKKIKANLRDAGLEVNSFNGSVLHEPWKVETKSGGPYKVYTPFSKACFNREPPRSAEAFSGSLSSAETWPDSLILEELGLLPRTNWAKGLKQAWTPGEKGAAHRLERFIEQGIHRYARGRDFPAEKSVSRLSPHLHWGEISPHRVWQSITTAEEAGTVKPDQAQKFKQELLWREFCYHLLYHFPQLPQEPLNDKFREFSWRRSKSDLRAWQKGRTGIPIVDAGMRELWQTGYMHNRVRMITASFLVKNLLIHWHHGEEWFWDTLVDADLANNSAGWQWVAGCGTLFPCL